MLSLSCENVDPFGSQVDRIRVVASIGVRRSRRADSGVRGNAATVRSVVCAAD
ncbi:hypothetical protein ACWEV3_17130 [Saccharopolyspora sp. NPDC003752]